MGSRTADHLGAIGEDPAEDDGRDSETETVASQNTEGNREGHFPSRPYWLDDDGLKNGEVDVLNLQEEQFWKDLLEKYLYPIDEDKAEKVKYNHIRATSFFSYILIDLNFFENVKIFQKIKNDDSATEDSSSFKSPTFSLNYYLQFFCFFFVFCKRTISLNLYFKNLFFF